MKRPIAIDLFSGCGGMSLGLEAAGFDIVASVEFDAIHTIVHHFNFPYGVSICKDIFLLRSTDLLQAIEKKGYATDIDLIAGGPPCQGFSQIGKRQLDDPRNSLVFEYLRIIKEVRPKYFIFENVPGLVSGKHKKFLNELINEFEKIGYVIEKPISILDACLYGAPQRRKRVILVGSRNDVKKASYPKQTHFEFNQNQLSLFDNQRQLLTTAKEVIGDLERHEAFVGCDQGIKEKLLDYTGFRKSFSIDPMGEYSLCHKRNVNRVVYNHIASQHTEKSIKRFQETVPGTTEKISRFFKLDPKGQCNTLRAGTASDKGAYTAPRPIHYSIPRCITVREAARLHTFPDWFRFHNTIWHGFREIGNAVIPFLAKSLGSQIVAAMNIPINELQAYELDHIKEELLGFNMGQASEFWGVPHDVIPKRKRLVKDAA
ncbi:MAG: DNA cytosine methyltransferase [Candidatus Electrothrix sp. ATG2]|nr:DNA cytosine methyltransferase [Candidatus Electrothrix sp. ATG2]